MFRNDSHTVIVICLSMFKTIIYRYKINKVDLSSIRYSVGCLIYVTLRRVFGELCELQWSVWFKSHTLNETVNTKDRTDMN